MIKIILILVLLFLSSCSGYGYRLQGESQIYARYYMTESSETLSSISKRFSVPVESLVWLNGLNPSQPIPKGNSILLSYGERAKEIDDLQAVNKREFQRARLSNIPSPSLNQDLYSRDKILWPLKKGTLVSGFGPRGKSFHDGIDIAAPKGTPVYSATSGKVIYSGNGLKGYGNLVIVKDPNSSLTVYAHNSKLFVTKGESVRKGSKIAEVGSTGKSSGPHLHFEIRVKKSGKGYIAVDPLAFFDRSGRKVGFRTNDTLNHLAH